MNRLISLSIAFVCFFSVSAQVTQMGKVLEYHGKQPKTLLSFVRVNVGSVANPAMSDENGDYQLAFSKLKAGDKVPETKVTKPGFVLFNKPALEQWKISTTTGFNIVMCDEKKFNELVQFYYGISTKSQEEQYKKDLAKIESLRTQDEKKFYSQLNELTEKYEREKKERQELAEIFARIDESELNQLDSTALSLINQGKIEEAIKIYEEAKLIEKFEQSKKKQRVGQELIDQGESEEKITSKSLENYMNTLKLEGGKENYEKLYELYERKAMADTTDFGLVFECASFFQNQNRFKTSEYMYYICLRIARSLYISNPDAYLPYVAMTLNNLANLHSNLNRYVESEKEYVEALEIYRKLSTQNPDAYLPDVATTLNNLASLHYNLNRYVESEKENDEALEIYRNLYTLEPDTYLSNIMNTLGSLSYKKLLAKQFDKAALAASEAINLCKEKNVKEEEYSWIYTNLAHALLFQNKFNDAKNLYLEWKDKTYPQDTTKTFKYYFLQDLDELEKAGITHPDIAKIRELLK